jgi:AcrR family transcriptional regulator
MTTTRPPARTAPAPAPEQPAADRPHADRPAAHRPDADRPDADRPDADRPDADRPDADRPDAPRRRGRPSGARAGGAPGTRERILAAARTVFSERGYDKASIRSIAKEAGVDSALVHHYFGTKEQVFGAAIELSFEPALAAAEILANGRDGIGERLARAFIGVWEDPAGREPLLAVVRSALTNDTAAAVLRTFVLRRLLEPVIAGLDVPDPHLRAELAASQMIGVAIMRYVLRAEPIASTPVDDVVALAGPALQRYLTGHG